MLRTGWTGSSEHSTATSRRVPPDGSGWLSLRHVILLQNVGRLGSCRRAFLQLAEPCMQPQPTVTADLLEAFADMVADRIASRVGMAAPSRLAQQIDRLERLAKELWHASPGKDVVSYDHEADRRWGFHFAIDGVLRNEEAQQLLGGCSVRTLQRHAEDGKIRRGKSGATVLYCRRSIMRYLASLEE